MASPASPNDFDAADIEPSLAEAVRAAGLSPSELDSPWLIELGGGPGERGRCEVVMPGGGFVWEAPPLERLFRGDERPGSLERYPESYVPFFSGIERNVAAYSSGAAKMPPTDKEMREIYNARRRRPDGRSGGPLHDHVWRACALVLAIRPWSRHQYEAVLARLEKSCRTFAMGAVSRNYVAHIGGMFS